MFVRILSTAFLVSALAVMPAAAQASAPRGNPGSDMQSLQQNREQDGQVIQDAQNALKALGR